MKSLHFLFFALILFSPTLVAQSSPPTGYTWIENPSNGHFYTFIGKGDNINVNGHLTNVGNLANTELVTIRSQAEEDWLVTNLVGMWQGRQSDFLCGYTDSSTYSTEGVFVWMSGEPVTYINWIGGISAPGNNNGARNFVFANASNSSGTGWALGDDTLTSSTPQAAIYEWIEPPADTDSDGLNDFEEAVYGTNPMDQDTDDDGLSDGEEVLNYLTDPTNIDTDDDGLQDGTEVGNSSFWPGDSSNSILGTDQNICILDANPSTTTNPLNDDGDSDGLKDGQEDRNKNGRMDVNELAPSKFDTDNDGIGDGVEFGLTASFANDTDLNVFVADADPSSTTNPRRRDTDGGGIDDGVEDKNKNGRIDVNEIDPADSSDDNLFMSITPITIGEKATFRYYGCEPGSWVHLCYSFSGAGPTFFNNVTLQLSQPIYTHSPSRVNSNGYAKLGPTVIPSILAVGDSVWVQGVQVNLFGGQNVLSPLNMVNITIQ